MEKDCLQRLGSSLLTSERNAVLISVEHKNMYNFKDHSKKKGKDQIYYTYTLSRNDEWSLPMIYSHVLSNKS